jgi:hypothetical protein
MQLPVQIPLSVWDLLEQLYLDSAVLTLNGQDSANYAGLTDDEKRAILKDFAKEQSVRSARWANIAQNLLSAELAS